MAERTVPDHAILQQAAEWFATLSDDDITEQDQTRWRAWINQSTEHQQAWHYVERVGQRFQLAQQSAGTEGVGRILNSSRAERISRRKALGGGLACMAALISWRYTPLSAVTQQVVDSWTADHHTATGETRQLTLADGGQLWLNTATAVDVNYNDSVRQISLRTGEVLIQTGKDSLNRPFVVNTRQGQLRALGTRFSVWQGEGSTLLTVYEGAVEIKTIEGRSRTLQAGEQALFSTSGIGQVEKAQRSRATWSQGLIVADNIPLRELVAELGRYRHGYLGVDPSVAGLKVMGTYPADKPDHALAMLEDALPIRINRLLPWWVTLEPSH
ncbi:MAG: FecR domain-containing protein [Porticoccaceae bacterium]|nr:FecR domain-containing protein [Porticoccaceae bacterium]